MRKKLPSIEERMLEAEQEPLQISTFFQVVGVIIGIILIIIKLIKCNNQIP